ncbi:hypothetical protein BGZ63DRAFT_52551 [Mariannaea sp. PMI_226]|nr:hypothetical protein BGZ63DRAFT_52551 [Mariannaea sp. PMI_226]
MSPTRGRAACNGCRARKQKCDETRPVCSRCVTLGRRCTWPVSRKRGPAKGYIEALEHRLSQTEKALVRLWQAVPEESLRSAFDSDNAPLFGSPLVPMLEADNDKLSRVGHDKSALIQQWEAFPLTSASSIEKWALHVKAATKVPQRMIAHGGTALGCQTSQIEPSNRSLAVQKEVDENHRQANLSRISTSIDTSDASDNVWVPESRALQIQIDDTPTRGQDATHQQLSCPTTSGDRRKIILTEEFQAQYVW